jgi:hypothetical protein
LFGVPGFRRLCHHGDVMRRWFLILLCGLLFVSLMGAVWFRSSGNTRPGFGTDGITAWPYVAGRA